MNDLDMFDSRGLTESFKAAGGWIDETAFELQPIENMGYGAIASRRIEAHTPLFHIPFTTLLTPWTSDLKDVLSEAEWEGLEGGWARLILSMMWEEHKGSSSRWAGYLANMPKKFETPMFWTDEERSLLKGTDIENRIGREDAEKEYHAKIVPILQSHPDIFPPSSPNFSLESYHIQGSRILSRSFTVPLSRAGAPPPEGNGEEDEEEEEEDEIAVMVPMADMLNAAYERDNARLFADDDEDEEEAGSKGEGYTMISTRVIEPGEQIYNTYAGPPNSELLRKYGHVDILPLSEDVAGTEASSVLAAWKFGNPGDEVEVSGDKVVTAIAEKAGKVGDESWSERIQQRVDWWLEDGQEDTFGLNLSDELDPSLVAFIRLLTHDYDWERAQRKGKLPSTTPDVEVCEVIMWTIHERLKAYQGSIEDDLTLIQSSSTSLNARNAAVVRLGEKRVLLCTLKRLEDTCERLKAEERVGGAGEKKRKNVGEEKSKSKSKRVMA